LYIPIVLRTSRRLSRVAAFAVALLALLTFTVASRVAKADAPTLAGSWSASPMSESVTTTSWPDDCGPKPKSGSTPGGSYKVTTSGDELVFSGSPAFRTDQCTDMGLAQRVSHSATPAIRWWKTRCESPKGNPLKATITTVVRAIDDDTIVLSESAQYSSEVKAGVACSASVERSRTFKIVAREGAAATPSATVAPTATTTAAPTPTPAPPPPTVSCDSVGDAATLEVRPRRKIMRPGESFEFKARVLDAKGCEVSNKATFRLAPESSSASTITVESNGKVSARADAEPVVAVIVVEAAGKTGKVELEIVTDDKYAKLLAAGGGAIDAGEDQAVSIELSGGGATASTVRDPGTGDHSRRRFAYLAIAGGACTLLGLAALVLWRRGNARAAEDEARRNEKRAENKAKAQRAPVQPVRAAPTPPTPVAIAPPQNPRPRDPSLAQTALGFAGSARVCPTCGTTPPPEAEFCPNDGTRMTGALAPQPAASAATPGAGGRICPVCGRKYERDAKFCSKDGVELVPLN
jgi:predicted nucleic acid-binding Zn ribbon protein